MEAKNVWMKQISLSALAFFRMAAVVLILERMAEGVWVAVGLWILFYGFLSYSLNKVLDYPSESTIKALTVQLGAATHEARDQTNDEMIIKYQAFIGELLHQGVITPFQYGGIMDYLEKNQKPETMEILRDMKNNQ